MQFLHPNVESTIVDNSLSFATAQTGTKLFCAYTSYKGEDNKLGYYSSPVDFLNANGEPNMKKYGQASYNILNWLLAGGEVYGIRVMPEDAKLAHSALVVKVKSTTATPTDILDVKLAKTSYVNITSEEALKLAFSGDVAVDGDGYSSYQLFTVYSKGRGEYGNNYSYRLTLNTDFKDTYKFRLYNFEVLETLPTGSVRVIEGPFVVSMLPEAISLGQKSMFIKNVVNAYSNVVRVEFNETKYDALIDVLMETGVSEIPEAIDFIFGKDVEGNAYDITKYTSSSESLNVNQVTGVALEGGSEGAFAMNNPGGLSARQTAIDDMLIAAYTGLVDEKITHKKNYVFNVVLDANFNIPVKNAIVQLCSEIRKDCVAILDSGIQPNAAATVDWRLNSFQAATKFAAIYSQAFTVYDSFTSSDVDVTITYFLASKIPTHDKEFGFFVPMAGPSRGIISGFKNMNFNPSEISKEALYKAQVNYVEQTIKNTRINAQNTSQTKYTALSALNNVRTVLEIQKAIENASEDFEFEYADATTLNSFQSRVTLVLSDFQKACNKLVGTVYQTPYDIENKIARVRIEVIFKNIIERIAIEIEVGK